MGKRCLVHWGFNIIHGILHSNGSSFLNDKIMCSFGILRLRAACGYLFPSLKSNAYILNRITKNQYQSVLRNSNLTRDVSKIELLDSTITAEKDKLLFYYENPKFFLYLNGFAIVQFFFWIHMTQFAFKEMKNIKPLIDSKEEASNNSFWRLNLNFKDNTTRTAISAFCFLIGYGILATAWMYTLRSVRMLVLRKGGKTVTFVTYGPLGKNRQLTVPLEKVSTNQTRATAKVQLPIKVQGKWFYYMLDSKNGHFPNPDLFDFTAGLKRTFTK